MSDHGELDQVMAKKEQQDNFYSDDSSTSSYDVQTNRKSKTVNQDIGHEPPKRPTEVKGDPCGPENNYGSPAIFDNGVPRISTGYIPNPKYDHEKHAEFYPRHPNCKNPYDKRGYLPGHNQGLNRAIGGNAGESNKAKYVLHENEKTVDVPVDKERVALDSYTADLNVHVQSPDALTAYPVTHSVSAWIFGNVRCTHGIKVPIEGPPSHIKVSSNPASSSRRVKCGFEVRIDECLDFDHDVIPRQEHREAHFIRVGWSEVNCQGNLGQERDSIGLDSLGRVLAEGQCFRHEFSKVCCNLRDGDVIGAYMEFDNETNQVHFSFRVNDKNLGVLAKIPAKPDESIFVPHILTKNMKFTCNFGTLGAYIAPKQSKKSKKSGAKHSKSKRRKRRDSSDGGSSFSSRSSSRSSLSSRSRSSSRSTFGSSDESDDDFEKMLAKKCPSLLPDNKSYLRFLPAVPSLDPNEKEKLDFDDENEEKKAEKFDKKARYAPLIGDDFHVSRIVRCAGIVFRETPETDKDCEVVMVMGLPGSGKSTWINKYTKEEEAKYKRYTVIGTESILGRASILGKPRNFRVGSTILPKTFNVNDKKEEGKLSDSDMLRVPMSHLQTKHLELSCTRKRNYILDQLNVFPGTHIKKMRGFEEFHRVAAVIMPSDKEYRKRKYKREEELKQEISRKNILELKSGIELPKADKVIFDKVLFPEATQEECEELVIKYREEGKEYALKRDHRPGAGYNNNRPGIGQYNNNNNSASSVGTGYVPGRSVHEARRQSQHNRGYNQGYQNQGYDQGYHRGGGYNQSYGEDYYGEDYYNQGYGQDYNDSYYQDQSYNRGPPRDTRKRPRERSPAADKSAAANPLAALANIPGLSALTGALGGANPLAALGGAGAAATANPLAALSQLGPEQQAQWGQYYQQVYQQYYQQYAALYGQQIASQMLAGQGGAAAASAAANIKGEPQ